MSVSVESKRVGVCIHCGVKTHRRIITGYAVGRGKDTWAYVCEPCEKKEYF